MALAADCRLEWDTFWSRFHAGNSAEHLHNARFAKLHEITHLLKTQTNRPSHILGIDSLYGRPIRVQATKTKPEIGNVLDIGSSRSGKSRREIAELLAWPGSVLVNDIKGELYRATAGYRRLQGRVFMVSPIGGRGNQIDPLAGRITERQLQASAHHLLFNPAEKDNYWIERGTKMLTQLFLAAREETRLARLYNPNAQEVRPLPYVGALCTLGLNEIAKHLDTISPVLAHKFLDAEYAPLTDYEKSTSRVDAWTTLSSRLYALLTDDIVKSFDGSDFTAQDLLFSKEPITVYFCWPEAELHSLTPLIRLVWETLINGLIQTYDLVNGVGCQPILLSLDEAGRTGLQNLPEYTATVNGRGIAISMSGQSFEQFKSLYGENRAKTLLNNMDSQIYHRQASYDTAKSLEGWLGYKSGWATSQSKHGDAESEGKSEREIPLLTARQIAQLPDDEIIILHRNIPPIQARRMELKRFPSLAAQMELPPPPVYRIAPPVRPASLPRWNRKYLNQGAYLMPMGTLPFPATLDELRAGQR